MGWYDIIDDAAKKQITKTELGDNRMYGVTPGIVAKKYSTEMPGRVCVQIPVRDEEANVLKWARVAMISAGKKWGTFFMPEIGDQVLLAFEEGNIDKPYIIGCVHKDNTSFLGKVADEDNRYKCIATKNGTRILFDDNKEGEGDKDKITVETAKSICSISMDNENQKIVISDKGKKNQVEMKLESGEINVKAEKKMVVEIGDIKVIIDGSSGKLTVKCSKFVLSSSDGIKLESDNMASLKGGNTTVEGSSGLKLSSGNAAVLEGSLIKLG